MTERIIFAAASVMRWLWLADAAQAVHRRTLSHYMFLQTGTASPSGVASNLRFAPTLKPKCWVPSVLLVPQHFATQTSDWDRLVGVITSCSVTERYPVWFQKSQLSWLIFGGFAFSLFFPGGVEVMLSGKGNPSGLQLPQEHIVGCNNGQQANQKE